MDGRSGWTGRDWLNRGGELLDPNPRLANRLLARGLQIDPREAVGWFNLGIGLHQRRRIPAAVRAYQHCLQLPHTPETGQAARNNLAQDLLLLGRWQEGWKLYGERFARKPGNHPLFSAAFGASWEAPLPRDRPLLLMSEQGLGDTLQFSRYALHLQNTGFDVSLLSQPPLVPLLREAMGLHQVIDQLDTAAWQARRPIWLPLLNLPGLLRQDELFTPFPDRYLQIEPARVAHWRQQLQRQQGKRLIALHWQGNPSHEHSLYSRGRSLPFRALLELKGLNGVEFVSIQKGAGSEQLNLDAGLSFVTGQAAVSSSMDFRDTAAVLANCDLLISADSAVVHLGGALGLPTWLALRWIPEWRWGLSGESTPWYESVRLFRQPKDGDWSAVIQAMRMALLA